MNLRDLVRTQKGGRTFTQLSADCGGYPSDKRLQQLATSVQKNFVDPKTIKALARGLRVTEVAVVLAAAEDLGLDVERATPKVLDYMPPGVNELGEDQLFAIGNMIRSFIPPALQDEPTAAERELAEAVTVRVPGRQEDYAKAARSGKSKGREARRRQDEESQAPDPDGPEFFG